MDITVAIIQGGCIAGLLYGLYLCITYGVDAAELFDARLTLKARHFDRDPLITDALAPAQTALAEPPPSH